MSKIQSMIAAAFLVGALLGAWGSGQFASGQPRGRGPEFEYKIVQELSDKVRIEQMNALGAGGWELVWVLSDERGNRWHYYKKAMQAFGATNGEVLATPGFELPLKRSLGEIADIAPR